MVNRTVFSEKTKLADVIKTNYRLLDIFPIFGIGLGFRERTVKQICEEKGISIPLFLLVCNIYTFDYYDPPQWTLEKIGIAELLDFLSATHKEYRQYRAPKIYDRTIELSSKLSDGYGKALVDLGKRYKQMLISHIEHEDTVEEPYIRSLLRGEAPDKPCVFEDEEQNYELHVSLHDLRLMLTKYLPDESVATLREYRDLLVDVALFDRETDKHILLEEILMEKVERLELARYGGDKSSDN